MAFLETFDGTTNQLVTERGEAGQWVLGWGENVLIVSSSGTAGKKNSASAPVFNSLFRPDDGSTDQRLGADFLGTGIAVIVMAQGATAAEASGYLIRYHNATSVRVYKFTNGAGATSPLFSVPAMTDTIGVELRAEKLSASSTRLIVYRQGVEVARHTDNVAPVYTSGRRGISTYAVTSVVSSIDNFTDKSIAAGALNITPRPVPFVEGVLAAGRISFNVTYPTPPATIEGRIVDGSGNALAGQGWSTKVASPAGTSATVSATNLPRGRDFVLEIRDSAVPATVFRSQPFHVGFVILINDQSIHEIMAGAGGSNLPAGMTSITQNNCFALTPSTKLASTATAKFGALNAPGASGSGYLGAADQIGRDLGAGHDPVLLVDAAFQGQDLSTWVADATPGGSTWPLKSGYLATMIDWVDGRITALCRPFVVRPGTDDVAGLYDQLVAYIDNRVVNQPSPFQIWVPFVERMSRGWDIHGKFLRAKVLELQNRGGRYRAMSGVITGARLRNDGDVHQADGANGATSGDPVAHLNGNVLIGRVYGRGFAYRCMTLLGQAPGFNLIGPTIVSAEFTDTSMTAMKVIYSREVQAKAGATGLTQHWTSKAAGWSDKLESTDGALQSDGRSVIFTKPAGATWTLDTRYDYCRDTPLDTSNGLNGGELNVQAALDRLLHDTSDFHGGRGLPVMPAITNGVPVAVPLVLTFDGNPSVVRARVRRPA